MWCSNSQMSHHSGRLCSSKACSRTSYLERPAEIARYREAMEYLRDAALSPRDSISLINQIRDNYQS